MNKLKYLTLGLLLVLGSTQVEARDFVGASGSSSGGNNNSSSSSGFRANCTEARSQIDLNVNNVRARLRSGGDMWWDGNQARYIVPNVDPDSGEPEVSSLFAGAIWLGAFDQGDNLVLAAQTYRSSGNDYWTGPLDPSTGQTELATCQNWDRHFEVSGASIDAIRADVLTPDPVTGLPDGRVDGQLPRDLRRWPARGNPYFASEFNFELPDQELAPFIDYDGDGLYNPLFGDHPVIEVARCPEADYNNPIYADQMIWWVYNDNGNTHTQSQGAPMQMEIQVTAFAYNTTDAINNMTFYRYKLLNRNNVVLNDTYFSLWSDPDLGCFDDDFIGSDTLTDVGYVYNGDANDDIVCGAGGTPGYGTDIPALAVDYFRGPQDSTGALIGLSSFQYHVNSGTDPTGDPTAAIGYYRLMSGFWPDGTAVSFGGNGYDPNNPNSTPYVFPSAPSDNSAGAWSMCQDGQISGNDFRFLHTSGPFVLEPGATNEIISGVVWVPELPDYPCPSIQPLLDADQLAQNLFDDCFRITNGPDAPYMDVVELENELLLNLSYIPSQNNYQLQYEESPAEIKTFADTTYNFQGFKIYQVENANVSVTDLEDPEQARLIAQVDLQDSIGRIVNWEAYQDPQNIINADIPVIKVDGQDRGLNQTFRITTDQFAANSPELVNFKPYYFCVVAYAYHDAPAYNPNTGSGQSTPYLQGRRNFRIYEGIPRPTDPEYFGIQLNSEYGSSPEITRLDGSGNGNDQFLELVNRAEAENQVLNDGKADELVYAEGRGPFNVKVVDPLSVPNGTFRLQIYDENFVWDTLTVTSPSGDPISVFEPNLAATPIANGDLGSNLFWFMEDADNNQNYWMSYQPLDVNYEQYIPELGISMQIVQVTEPGQGGTVDTKSGYVGSELIYTDPNATPWYAAVEDAGAGLFNVLKTGNAQPDQARDPLEEYSDVEGGFVPHMLADCRLASSIVGGGPSADFYFSPNRIASAVPNPQNVCDGRAPYILRNLRNVNVVMTPDKSKWSRCIVVETATTYHSNAAPNGLGLNIPTGLSQLEWKRNRPSVDKEGNIEQGAPNGYSWFPGYAYDVSTGERLNIYFGENSIYNGDVLPAGAFPKATNGDDMIFNPNDLNVANLEGITNLATFYLANVQGGQHHVFVANSAYDSCQNIASFLELGADAPTITGAYALMTQNEYMWAAMPYLQPGTSFDGPRENIPPSELTVKLRVSRPYSGHVATGDNNGYPLYEFSLDGYAPDKEAQAKADDALDLISVVPNPYYSYSEYEVTELETKVRITNLPPECNIRIYSVAGQFIREYNIGNRYPNQTYDGQIARRGFDLNSEIENQIDTYIDWDLQNQQGVPVASGVYLIHVKVPGVGERVLKSFIISRAFDPQRL